MVEKFKSKSSLFQVIKGKKRGSALVYTFIVLTIMLMSALSVAFVTVMDKRSASDTANSAQALALADAGIEKISNGRNLKGNQTLADLFSNYCSSGIVTFDNIASISGGMARIISYSGLGGASQVNSCDVVISSITKVKSIGIYRGTVRVFEVSWQ